MDKLLLFESFVEKIYEIKFTAHWKERSATAKEENAEQSRIQQYSEKFKFGWTLEGLIDNRRDLVNTEEFLKNTSLDTETLKREIVEALRVLTRSSALEKWRDLNSKFQLLDLGKIGIYNGNKTLYPLFKTKSIDKGITYEPAEGVWGIADQNEGITFMYYPANKKGAELFYSQARRSSKLKDLDFLKSANFFSPYGQGFKLIIDATDPSPASRVKKLEKQVQGEEIEFGPEKEKEYVSVQIAEPQRKTFSPGDSIGAIVKYVSATEPIPGKIKEIINISEIKDAQKAKNLDKIKEIKIKFIPDSEDYRKISSDGKVLAIPVTLTDGSIFTIKNVMYKILGPSGNKPLITSEPSIINAGSIQTWAEETK
jgi:hypothetical protein